MRSSSTHLNSKSPIAIGGIGGSGTRVVARMLMECGFYLGSDMNNANDNLWFSLIFRRPKCFSDAQDKIDDLATIFVKAMLGGRVFSPTEVQMIRELANKPRPELPTHWLHKRASSLLATTLDQPRCGPWGWKEPNTHIVIDRLSKSIPSLKYIHVIRNGLDMAYSHNQNQLQLWGPELLNEQCPVSPKFSLRFWHQANRRVIRFFEDKPQQFLLLNFDHLCITPLAQIPKLLQFLEIPVGAKDPQRLASLLKKPQSVGRFKAHSTADFDEEDVHYVHTLGFDTTY